MEISKEGSLTEEVFLVFFVIHSELGLIIDSGVHMWAIIIIRKSRIFFSFQPIFFFWKKIRQMEERWALKSIANAIHNGLKYYLKLHFKTLHFCVKISITYHKSFPNTFMNQQLYFCLIWKKKYLHQAILLLFCL